jgi:butyryl-CoA dehydrogenase
VEHHYRNCRINRIYEGTNEINRLIITQTLLKRALSGRLGLMERLQEILVQLKTGFPETESTHPLSEFIDQVERLKRLAVYLAGVATQAYTTELEKHQSVLALIADAVIEVYALESGLIRALKIKSMGHTETKLPEAIITAAIAERVPIINQRIKQALINIAQDDEKNTERYLKAYGRIIKPLHCNTASLQETIAAHVLEREMYDL